MFREYADDGWSGTNFDRPAFQELLADVEAGLVHTVLIKDLSRLGRDYIRTGQYTELYFPAKGVRCIAVDDAYDSAVSDADIVPFKNVFNELYARDTSKKIRAALTAQMKAGHYIGSFAPFGYRKDPADRHRLLPDPAAAPVVEELFRRAAAGETPGMLAADLNRRGIPTPSAFRFASHPGLCMPQIAGRGQWDAGAVRRILDNPVYLGRTAQGKTAKLSFKSSVTRYKPESDWIVVADTHPPLVTPDIRELALTACRSRLEPRSSGFSNLFSGVAFCADCGRAMSAVKTRRIGGTADLVCGGYKSGGGRRCSGHAVAYEDLYRIVLSVLRKELALSPRQRAKLLEQAAEEQRRKAQNSGMEREKAALRRRAGELERILEQLYEDRAAHVLSPDRFVRMFGRYEAEQTRLWARLEELNRVSDSGPDPAALNRELSARLDELTALRVLTAPLLRAFVERIEVEQGSYAAAGTGRVKTQAIRLVLRFSPQTVRQEVVLSGETEGT